MIPKSLQSRVIKQAHLGHAGINKTNELIEQSMWFRGCKSQVENFIKQCCCQAVTSKTFRAPLEMTELPSAPMHTVGIDFKGPLPYGIYLLVIVCLYSRYPLVFEVMSTSNRATLPKLESVFTQHGMPVVIKSDNGPPFQSHEFKEYCLKNGIIHKKICPLWPEANGTTEKFMQVINKIIQCAEMEGSNWRHELNMALLNYRASPHCSTKIPPATLFLGRKIRTILPALPTKFHNENDGKARENDSANKQKWKLYADKDRSTRPHNLKLGDIVMVEQNQNNSLMSKFDPAPRTVTFVKGDLITATRGDGHEISRNSSFFKKMQKGVECDVRNQNA